MKTLFTIPLIRTFVITFVIALFTLNLTGQTRHTVAVTDYVFTPAALTVSAGDTVVWTNNGAMGHNVNGTQATYPTNPESFGNEVGLGWTYEYVFETAGTYNYQCDPHVAFGMIGSVTVNPAMDDLMLTVNLTSMTPHVGQTLWFALIDQETEMEIGRVKQTGEAEFSVEIPGIEVGRSYWFDFFADHNGNGVYDAPPVDHAWRLPLTDVTGDESIDFVHNTAFTDIEWKTKLTLQLTAMTPHVGQMMTFYIRDDRMEGLDTVIIEEVTEPNFEISSWVIEPTMSYYIDFYADHNSNGNYDAPPTDHAWRIALEEVERDTILSFVHNTVFTDIFAPNSTPGLDGNFAGIRLYPNPASQYIELLVNGTSNKISSFKVYSVAGTLIDEKVVSKDVESFRYDVSSFKKGVYFMEINSGNEKNTFKFLKQ